MPHLGLDIEAVCAKASLSGLFVWPVSCFAVVCDPIRSNKHSFVPYMFFAWQQGVPREIGAEIAPLVLQSPSSRAVLLKVWLASLISRPFGQST